VDGIDLSVDFHAQFAAGGVGAQVDTGGEEPADEAAGIVVAAEGFARELDGACFSSTFPSCLPHSARGQDV